jgi:hypothetical protein
VDKKLSVWSWCQTWSQLQSQKQTVQQRHHLKWNTPGSWRHHGQWPSPNFEPNRFHVYHFSHVDMFAFWTFELWLGFCDTPDHHSKNSMRMLRPSFFRHCSADGNKLRRQSFDKICEKHVYIEAINKP